MTEYTVYGIIATSIKNMEIVNTQFAEIHEFNSILKFKHFSEFARRGSYGLSSYVVSVKLNNRPDPTIVSDLLNIATAVPIEFIIVHSLDDAKYLDFRYEFLPKFGVRKDDPIQTRKQDWLILKDDKEISIDNL